MKRKHRDLPVWTAAMDLVQRVYEVTRGFPVDERYGLVAQMRRAAVSVPANIAEGSARRSTAELIQFLHIASGSLAEIDAHLEIARRLGFVNVEGSTLQQQLDAVHAQLLASIASLKRRTG